MNALPCGLRLAAMFAEAGRRDDLFALVDEADALFLPPGCDHEAARFYHEIARLAGGPALSAARDDLRDRARLGLAAKLPASTCPGRGSAGYGTAASALLGGTATVDPFRRPRRGPRRGGVHEACAPKIASPIPREEPSGNPRYGHVTAACGAPESDEIFLGFEGGEVYCFRPRTSEVILVAALNRPVVSLAASADGRSLIALDAYGDATHGTIGSYARQAGGSYRRGLGCQVISGISPRLTPILGTVTGDLVGYLQRPGDVGVLEVA